MFAHGWAPPVGGFSAQVSLVRADRTGTAQLHDYGRTTGELRFVRLFCCPAAGHPRNASRARPICRVCVARATKRYGPKDRDR